MSRLVDVDKLISSLGELVESGMTGNKVKACLKLAIQIADAQPTVDADAVKHGHWEIDEKRYGNKDPHCSICRAILEGDADKCRNNYYCYHCGAKMDEVTE